MDTETFPTLDSNATEVASIQPPAPPVWKKFPTEITRSKEYRKKLIPQWRESVDYRRGKPFASHSDEDRVIVNLDWSLTKAKQASLFSQIPQVRVDHFPQTVEAGPWIQAFEQRINDTIVLAGIETAMDECVPDCINAAGFSCVLVAHESLTEDREIPTIDLSFFPPELQSKIFQTGQLPDGSPVPMDVVPVVIDHRYTITRISPADALIPLEFTGSNFDNAPWVGRTGRTSWVDAKNRFKLKDSDKERVCGDSRTFQDRISNDLYKNEETNPFFVEFDEIWYKEHLYSDATSFSTIHHLVFVNGIDAPVIDEPWKGQDFHETEDGEKIVIGSLKYPLRFLTLTYITDEAIPPSDSAIGRPQVNEINKARTQMIMQRERSIPVRWFDVNRIDPLIQQALMRGTWQNFIPVQGAGDHSVGEVARASMPQEDFTFNDYAKNDLAEGWNMGPNQRGDFGAGRQSATEANVVESNFQTRIGRERAKVAKFFVSIAEVLGGLLALYEPPLTFGEGFDPSISRTLAYSILADSTVLIDSNQRLKRIQEFVDFTAKSGYLNIEPVLREIAQLSGLDPNKVIKAPEPVAPPQPNISMRISGAEDLQNPIVYALMEKMGQMPDASGIENAKKMIILAQTNILPPEDVTQPPSGPTESLPPADRSTPEVGDANPKWALMNTVSKRSDGQQEG